MRSFPRSNVGRHHMPFGFKLWFAFVLAVILIICGGVGYGLYTVANDPAAIGRFLRSAADGFTTPAPLPGGAA